MLSNDDEDVVGRFARETASVTDPEPNAPEGEVLPPLNAASEEPNNLENFITPEFASLLLGMPANAMARKTGKDWWRLDEEENQMLGKTCAPAMQYLVRKYLGETGGPLAAMGIALGVVYGPRMAQELKERKEESDERRNPQNSQGRSASLSANEDAERASSSGDWQGAVNES